MYGATKGRQAVILRIPRKCLRCRHMFKAIGKFNCVCPRCDRLNEAEPERIFVFSCRDGLCARQREAMKAVR